MQRSWLRLSRSDPKSIENLAGWLTGDLTLAHVTSRGVAGGASDRTEPEKQQGTPDPEQEAQMAESVGLALLWYSTD